MNWSTWKRTAGRMAAGVIAAGVIGMLAVPAAAAQGVSYAAVAGSDITINKYLVLNKNAQVPDYTFQYSIAAGSAMDAQESGGVAGMQVYAGDDKAKVTGSPTIGTAAFTGGQSTWLSAQALASAGIQVPGGAKDPVTLSANEKYAKSAVTVSFSGVTFKEPGIYRYIITEAAASADAFITDDEDLTRTMDVYVIDSKGKLEIQGYVLHDDQTVVSQDGTTLTNDEKAFGFVNHYNTADLSVTKKVTGNEASRDEYFEVAVQLSHAMPGTVYQVDLSGCEATTRINGVNTTAHTNPTSITTDAAGSAAATFWLQNNQTAVIQGLTYGAAYSLSQNKTTMEQEGYTVTITNDDDDAVIQNGEFHTSGTIDEGEKDDGLVDVVFTDLRAGVLPTGVMVTMLPGAVLLIAAGAGITYMINRKKRNDSV